MLEFYWAESLRIQQKNQKIMQAGLAWQMQNAGTFKAFEKRFAEWMHPKLGQDGTKEEHF